MKRFYSFQILTITMEDNNIIFRDMKYTGT